MKSPLICLVVMVKNEADNVRALLESARPHVDDVCVTDTGSTDGTQDIVRETLGNPAKLYETRPIMARLRRSDREVFDFAANRNFALDLAEQGHPPATPQNILNKPTFTLFLSGHETLHVEDDTLRKFLLEHRDAPDGAYCVQMRAGARAWPFTRVLRVSAGWRYHGKRHECPIGLGGESKGPLIPGVSIVHAPPAEDRERKIARLRDEDLPIFEDTVEDDSLTLEQRSTAMLFLAETHMLLAVDYIEQRGGKLDKIEPGSPWLSHQMAAMALYWRYAQIGEQPGRPGYSPEKVHYAIAQYYSIAGQIPGLYTHEEIARRLKLLAEQAAPKMPELRWLFASHLAKHAEEINSVPDLKMALYHAIEAAKLARQARLEPTNYEVSETNIEWRGLLLAADCAEVLGKMADSKEEQVLKASQARKLYEAAAKAGAPKRASEAGAG